MPSGAVLCTFLLVSSAVLINRVVVGDQQPSEVQPVQKDSVLQQQLSDPHVEQLDDEIKNRAGSDGLHTLSKTKKKDKADPIDAPKNVAHPLPVTIQPQKSPVHNITTPPKEQNSTTVHTPVGPGSRVNSGSLLRGFYVFLGLGFIVIMYLIARTVRLKQTVTRVHKYGIISNRDDLEMAHLEAEDDENEVLFELPVK